MAPKLALISQSDGLVLPIILVLGLLALVYLLGDLARRRGPAFVVRPRQRLAGSPRQLAATARSGVTP